LGDESGPIRFFHATLGPIDLPPGFYSLEVMLDDEITGARLSRYLPLAVIMRGRPLILEAALGDVVRRPSLTTQGAAPGLSHQEIAARYADALQLLGEGERYAAREAVLELERLALGSGSQREFVALARIERQLVRELAETDSGVLRPISLLHRDVLRQQAAFDEQRLVDHSWPMAAEFAEQAWETRRPGEDEGFACTLLVALAADLIRIAAVSPAIDLLNRALEIAPDDPAALLALGATYERSGLYEEAIGPLRTLVRELPENAEGELRLAINLARAGRTEDAEGHFRALIADSAPTWITVIAYQELARLLPSVNAEPVLREGFQRFPSNQALQVQLAYVLDDLGRTAEAADLVESISRSGSAPETSPRVRYPAWPSLGLEGRMNILEEEAAVVLPALVTALDAARGAETTEDQT
jgi:tetratricopeptide (TPR) repeat protein